MQVCRRPELTQTDVCYLVGPGRQIHVRMVVAADHRLRQVVLQVRNAIIGCMPFSMGGTTVALTRAPVSAYADRRLDQATETLAGNPDYDPQVTCKRL